MMNQCDHVSPDGRVCFYESGHLNEGHWDGAGWWYEPTPSSQFPGEQR